MGEPNSESQSSEEDNRDLPDSAEDRQTYRSIVHWPLVIGLLVMVLLSGSAGWILNPRDGLPAAGDENLQFSLNFSTVPTQLHISETVAMTAAPYRLSTFSFAFSGYTKSYPAFTRWTLYLPHFSGELCHDPGMHISKSQGVPVLRGAIFNGPGGIIDQAIEMCWADDPPALVSGPYLAVTFPFATVDTVSGSPFNPASNAPVSTSESLLFGDLGLGSYTLESGPAPTAVASDDWQWDTKSTDAEMGPDVIYATNIFQLQQDNRNAFLAGIFLGLAGAAVIAVLQELLSAIRRRHPG
jgi:hypothetical protein